MLPFSLPLAARSGKQRIISVFGRPMPLELPTLSDPRLQQVTILTSLHILSHLMLPFPVTLMQTVLTVAICALLDCLFTMARDRVVLVPLSGVIAALSFTMLVGFAPGFGWLYLVGAVLIPLGKHAFRWRGSHLFNPSNFAITLMLLFFPNVAAVTPALWPASLFLLLLLGGIGTRLIRKAKIWRVTVAFLVAELLLFVAFDVGHLASVREAGLEAWYFFAAPLTLIYSFFMITDPKTAPRSPVGRMRYAIALAVLHRLLALVLPSPVALFVALFWMCGLRPLLVKMDARWI